MVLFLQLSPAPIAFDCRVTTRMDPSALAINLWHGPKRSPLGPAQLLAKTLLFCRMNETSHCPFASVVDWAGAACASGSP